MTQVLALLETGLFQPERISNGMRDLERRLLEFIPEHMVLRCRWTVGEQNLAVWIRAWYGDVPNLHIILTGHSLGGRGVNRVATLLDPIPVYAEVLCDAFGDRLGRESITVPTNVQVCHVFRSEENWIEGSPVVAQDLNKTKLFIHPPINVPHAQMDEQQVYQDLVISLCQET